MAYKRLLLLLPKLHYNHNFEKNHTGLRVFAPVFFLDFGHAFPPLSDDPALFWPELERVQPGGRADRCVKPTFLGRREEPGAA